MVVTVAEVAVVAQTLAALGATVLQQFAFICKELI
jgi:hypothetical protein